MNALCAMRMNFDVFVASSIDQINEGEWNRCAGENTLVRHAFFRALEQSGSLGAKRGVIPRYVALRDASGRLLACAPGMLKWGNKREFGPEMKWLQAGEQANCFAWPKFQVGMPFYPMMGPRLLTHPDFDGPTLRTALMQCLLKMAARSDGRAVFNVMHITPELANECLAAGALISYELRSAWYNPGYESFADYVAQLPNRKRYKLIKERRHVELLGLQIRTLSGDEISSGLISEFYEGFCNVSTRYRGKPWLPESMLQQLRILMPEAVRLMAAFDGDRFVAGSFCLQDGDTLHGDIWSAMVLIPELCFELVCYRKIVYAIEQRLRCVDVGPVGKHKSERGYIEERICHAHWFYNDQLKGLAAATLVDGLTANSPVAMDRMSGVISAC